MKIDLTTVMAFFLTICPGSLSAQSSVVDKPRDGLSQLADADTPLRNGDVIAIFGDSVTMQGGYVQLMQTALSQSPHTKQLDIKLIKHGLNGGRVPTVLQGKSAWGDLGGTMQELTFTRRF